MVKHRSTSPSSTDTTMWPHGSERLERECAARTSTPDLNLRTLSVLERTHPQTIEPNQGKVRLRGRDLHDSYCWPRGRFPGWRPGESYRSTHYNMLDKCRPLIRCYDAERETGRRNSLYDARRRMPPI